MNCLLIGVWFDIAMMAEPLDQPVQAVQAAHPPSSMTTRPTPTSEARTPKTIDAILLRNTPYELLTNRDQLRNGGIQSFPGRRPLRFRLIPGMIVAANSGIRTFQPLRKSRDGTKAVVSVANSFDQAHDFHFELKNRCREMSN